MKITTKILLLMGIVMVGFISDSPTVKQQKTVVTVDSLVFQPLVLPDKTLTNELISLQNKSLLLKKELQKFKEIKAYEDSLRLQENYFSHR